MRVTSCSLAATNLPWSHDSTGISELLQKDLECLDSSINALHRTGYSTTTTTTTTLRKGSDYPHLPSNSFCFSFSFFLKSFAFKQGRRIVLEETRVPPAPTTCIFVLRALPSSFTSSSSCSFNIAFTEKFTRKAKER